jgi:hypothetical protein
MKGRAMAHHRFIGMLIGLGMMSACNAGDERRTAAQNDNAADVAQVSGDGDPGSKTDGNDASIAIDLPGIKGNFKLPKLTIASDDVDIDGVRLYPGSRVHAFEIAGEDGANEGSLTLRFEADASPATVQRYFLDAFRDKGVSARAQGSGVAGTDHDGKPFSILLDGKGSGTRGVVKIGNKPG